MTTSAHRPGPRLSSRAVGVQILEDAAEVVVSLEDGRTIAVPIAWFPRLADASPEQRNHWKLVGKGIGIHWPDIDEDVSVDSLLGADGELLTHEDSPTIEDVVREVADERSERGTQLRIEPLDSDPPTR